MVIIINLGSQKTPDISSVLSKLAIENKIILPNQIDIAEIENAKAIILSGSPVLLSEIPGKEYNDYLLRYDFLKSMNKPVLGICFGHQLLGILHGARIGKCTPDRDWQDISILAKHLMFNKFNQTVKMKQDHQEQITVPPHFLHLGTSVICENEAMAHPVKKIISVQFHPEVSEENGLIFFQNVMTYFGVINN